MNFSTYAGKIGEEKAGDTISNSNSARGETSKILLGIRHAEGLFNAFG
jgi:hypothetical protein